MKDNKIDNLFKTKLNGHTKSPSPMAWEKLNSELSKKDKKSRFLWWQKAAILILICLSGLLIFNVRDFLNKNQSALDLKENDKSESLILTPQKSKVAKELLTNKSPEPGKESAAATIKSLSSIEPKEEKQLAKRGNEVKNKIFLEIPINQYVADNSVEKGAQEQQVTSVDSKGTTTSKQKENTQVQQVQPPVTIEFRSGKRKTEHTLIAEKEAVNEDQSFSFKKLVARVKDVKEGELGLADLRQAKDELFALETYKGNSKSSNK